MNRFNQDTAVEKIADNLWRGQLSDDWCIGPVPNGGYVLAVAAKALSEALPHRDPLAFNHYGPLGWVPTIELNVQVRAKPVAGPIQCHFEMRYLTNGALEEDGTLWDSEGNIVALSRQTAKLRLSK